VSSGKVWWKKSDSGRHREDQKGAQPVRRNVAQGDADGRRALFTEDCVLLPPHGDKPRIGQKGLNEYWFPPDAPPTKITSWWSCRKMSGEMANGIRVEDARSGLDHDARRQDSQRVTQGNLLECFAEAIGRRMEEVSPHVGRAGGAALSGKAATYEGVCGTRSLRARGMILNSTGKRARGSPST
jgi:hypothetical protein